MYRMPAQRGHPPRVTRTRIFHARVIVPAFLDAAIAFFDAAMCRWNLK